MLEIYNNPPDQVPAYGAMNPLLLHVAFVCDDPAGKSAELIAAGAALVNEVQGEGGLHLITLRDPWGLAIQLCRRGKPLLR